MKKTIILLILIILIFIILAIAESTNIPILSEFVCNFRTSNYTYGNGVC